MSNVARVFASELPSGSKVSNSSKVLVQEAVSEFICFVASEARDICDMDERRAITVNDIADALDATGARPPPRPHFLPARAAYDHPRGGG